MAVIQTTHIYPFVLQVQDKYYFHISSFELTYAVGSIPSCSIQLMQKSDTQLINNANGIPQFSSFQKLVQYTSSIQGNLVKCKLLQWESDKKKTCFFQGYVTAVNTHLTAGTNTYSGVSCVCMAPACRLVYAVHSDFVYTPQSVAKDYNQLQTWGVGDINKLLGTSFGQTLSITDQILKSNISVSDNIADMLNKLFISWTEYKKQKQFAPDFQSPALKLSQFFQSEYMLSKYAVKLSTSKTNAFIKQLSTDFVNGLLSDTIFASVIYAIGGDKLLTVTPTKLADTKLSIIPAFITPYQQGLVIKANDIASIDVSLSPMTHLRTPNVVYVNMSKYVLYQAGKNNNRGIYGRYPAKGQPMPAVPKVKIINGPNWLLQASIQGACSKAVQTTQLRNYAVGQNQKSSPQPVIQQILQTDQDNISLRDAYAKAIFFNTYLRDKRAVLELIVKPQSMTSLVNYLGKSVLLQCPVTLSQAQKAEYAEYYGVLNAVQYIYTASSSVRQSSSFRIRCSVDGLTSKQDKVYASFYTQTNSVIDSLYVKKS